MTEQAREPSEDNRMAALQLIARQSVTRLAEILDSKDEAIATARKERDEARAAIAALEASNTEQAQMLVEVERLRPAAEAWESCVATAKEIWTFGHERGGERQMLQHVEYLLAGIDARAAKEKGA